MNKSVCIFGGTFDPVHIRHLTLAQEVLDLYAFEKIIFVPCKLPVHKESEASAADRLAMLEIALSEYAQFDIDRREIERETPSYMVPTLESFHEQYPEYQLYLLVGVDAFLQLESWYQWEKLLDLAHILVAPRIGYKLPIKGILSDLVKKQQVTLLDTIPTDTSATMLREKINNKDAVKNLLPEKIYDYIHARHLYHAD